MAIYLYVYLAILFDIFGYLGLGGYLVWMFGATCWGRWHYERPYIGRQLLKHYPIKQLPACIYLFSQIIVDKLWINLCITIHILCQITLRNTIYRARIFGGIKVCVWWLCGICGYVDKRKPQQSVYVLLGLFLYIGITNASFYTPKN